jgi:hypothetical protein
MSAGDQEGKVRVFLYPVDPAAGRVHLLGKEKHDDDSIWFISCMTLHYYLFLHILLIFQIHQVAYVVILIKPPVGSVVLDFVMQFLLCSNSLPFITTFMTVTIFTLHVAWLFLHQIHDNIALCFKLCKRDASIEHHNIK